ncbi:hypothetical protein CDL15_Pgr005039 [Punica granatum]|uniref:Uncharacterized protein n=1 Tax=Punica granatum TaxID=22663 RepID=A0A218WAW2_PUNGR|nr:hypothetical protein CDL15_Pgr005039 [Punica granatum]
MQPKRGKLSAPYFGPPASHSRIPDRSPGRYSSTGNQRQIGGHGVMSNKRRARSTEKGGREQSKERTDKESRKRRSRHCGTIPNAFPGQAARAGTPRSLTDAFSNRAPGARSTDKQTALQNGPTGTQGPSRSANKLQMTFRNSTWFPEGRFSGRERLPASLRGTSTEDRDHNDPRAPHNDLRAPQDIQRALRKSQSKSLGLPGPTVLDRGRQANDPPRGKRIAKTNVRMHKEQSGTKGH